MIAERRGRAMGTRFHLVVVDGRGDADAHQVTAMLDRAAARLDELERRWSRFSPDSEISALNADPERMHLVSLDTLALVERGVAAWHATDGAFDPSVLPAVVASGYDRPFETIGASPTTSSPKPSLGCTGITTVRLGDNDGLVSLGEGGQFDPGGIGKGLAADVVVDELLADGADGAMVNIGGDVVCRGLAPTTDGWVIDVSEPNVAAHRLALLAIREGAVATSTTRKRRWAISSGDEDRECHHVIDPASGESTMGPDLATVVAGEGWWAEVVATQLLVDSTVDVHSCDCPALVVFGGVTTVNTALKEFLR